MVSANNVEQAWKPDSLTKLYIFSLCLLVYAAADILWWNNLPIAPLFIPVCILGIIRMMYYGVSFSPTKLLWITVWFFFNLYIIGIHRLSGIGIGIRLLVFLAMTTVILLPVNEMKYLLKALTICFVVILVISIPAWILYLMGVPLPHTGPYYHSNGFHVYYDYVFFRTSANITSSDYNRFSSVFLEPGQMATPCMFLFHLNTRNGKLFQFKNIIMLIGVVMSFSLIAYGLLIASLIINQMSRSKYRVPLTVSILLILGGLTYYFTTHTDNAVNALIVSRLEYDEYSGISGYNRTNESFDVKYDRLLESSDKYFGIHNELKGNNWTTYASGYKKYIVHNGIIGLGTVLLLMLLLFLDNKNRQTLAFILMVVVAFLVRDLLTSPLWLSITIIGMYIIGSEKIENNSKKEVQYSEIKR